MVYVPSSYVPGHAVPLMVMLHGCAVTAAQMMVASEFNPLADKDDFIVLYPDVDRQEAVQPDDNNYCWDYYNSFDWKAGGGDPAAVLGMVHAVSHRWSINAQRIYAVGMSAGSYLVADLAAIYPNVFAAVAEDAGGGYEDYDCVAGETSLMTLQASAELAYNEEGRAARVVPRLVLGGDKDPVVPPACATKALVQSLRTNNLVIDHQQTRPIRLTPASVVHEVARSGYQYSRGYQYTVASYRDQYRCVIGERYLVHNMVHFWSGGSTDPLVRNVTDPSGPSAAVATWNFASRYTLRNTRHPC
jgi:poly(hydroxyalkanoate) depolymerase family esterase